VLVLGLAVQVPAQTFTLSAPETWLAHQGAVTTIAYDPDGRYLVSGGMDHLVKRWDSARRIEPVIMRGHAGPVWAISYAPDGSAIVSASKDQTLRIWNSQTSDLSSTIDVGASVLRASISHGRLWLMTTSGDKKVKLRNYRMPGYAHLVPEPTDGGGQAVFIPGDNLLAIPTASGNVLLYDPATKEPAGELTGASSPMAASGDGRWLATGNGRDDILLLWDIQSKSVVATFKGHLKLVFSLQFSPDGRWLASARWDHTIRVWDIERRRMVFQRDEERPVWAVAFSPDGKSLAAGEEDGILRRWEIRIANVPAFSKTSTGSTPLPSTIATGVDQAPVSSIQRPDAVGVILGVEKYRYAPAVSFARYDARIIREYFVNTLGLSETNIYIRTDGEATQGEFRKVFDPVQGWLAKRIKPGISEVFVYYVGHGAPDLSTGDAYLMPSDGDPNYPATSYRIAELYRSLEQLPVRRATVLLDACFSGRVGRGKQVEMLMAGACGIAVETRTANPGEHTAVLTASAGNQVSSGYPEKSHGLFTYFVLRGLQGAADTDGDRSVTIRELFVFVRQQVSAEAGWMDREQTPEWQGNTLDETLVKC